MITDHGLTYMASLTGSSGIAASPVLSLIRFLAFSESPSCYREPVPRQTILRLLFCFDQ